MKLGENSSKSIAVGLMLTLVFVLIFNYDKWYTLVNFSLAIPLTLIVLKYNPKLLQHFFLTFLVMLIPFFIVNGVLTGSWIENQVVWYNNAENLGIRMGTIPVEDSIYAYSMILMSLFFFELLSSRHISDQN
jgi:lycopene cyclase domain-containing protein